MKLFRLLQFQRPIHVINVFNCSLNPHRENRISRPAGLLLPCVVIAMTLNINVAAQEENAATATSAETIELSREDRELLTGIHQFREYMGDLAKKGKGRVLRSVLRMIKGISRGPELQRNLSNSFLVKICQVRWT